MKIITIRGQLGSLSLDIGRALARTLKMDYVDREIIGMVAERLKKSEADIIDKEMPPGSFLGHVVEALKHSYIAGAGSPAVYLPAWEIPLDDKLYLSGLVAVIKELASDGPIVIRGRGSQFILKERPDTFHVLLVAPPEVRLRRVMANLRLDEESARRELARDDSSRREFTRRYFRAELEDPLNYDMVVNTGKITIETGVSMIAHAVGLLEKKINAVSA